MSLAMIQADCKRAVASLAGLSNDELDAIMNDDDKINDILAGLDRVSPSVTHTIAANSVL